MSLPRLWKGKTQHSSATPRLTSIPPRPPKSYPWPAIFSHPRVFDLDIEDQSYLDFWHRQEVILSDSSSDDEFDEDDEDEDEDDDGSISSEEGDDHFGTTETPATIDMEDHFIEIIPEPPDPVRVFMAGLGDKDKNPHYRDQTKVVTSFCQGARGDARSGKSKRSSRRVAFVDDQCNARARSGNPRPSASTRGASSATKVQEGLRYSAETRSDILTREQLLERLGKPRFSGQPRKGNYRTTQHHHDFSSAFRRLVYFPGLDAEGIRDLVETAPKGQRIALVALLYRHIKPEPMLGVEIESGFRTYALHFHSPFYALREHKQLRRDPRLKPDGEPLRNSWVLDCLSLVPTHKWCLYESQTSIVVYGISDSVWTAYGIIDDYYDPQWSIKTHYRKWRQSELKIFSDPITRQESPLLNLGEPGVLIWDGRGYFLQAVKQHCSLQVKEWESVVSKMEELARKGFPAERERNNTRAGRAIKDFDLWNEEMLRFLRLFIDRLSRTTRVWHGFKSHNIRYFGPDHIEETGAEPGPTELREDCLNSIAGSYSQLREYLARLETLKNGMIESNRHKVGSHINFESHRATARVNDLAELAIFFLPLTLAAGIFNMQPSVLPFSQNLTSFLFSILVIALAVAAVNALLIRREARIRPAIHILLSMLRRSIGAEATASPKGLGSTEPDSPPVSPPAQTEHLVPECTPGPKTVSIGTKGPLLPQAGHDTHRVISLPKLAIVSVWKAMPVLHRFQRRNSESNRQKVWQV